MNQKDRITISLGHLMLSKLDRYIDGVRIRNRSHAIEYLLSKTLRDNKPSKAFILAGGKGTRMRPITYELPKPMLPVKGRPILEHTISLLRKHDVRDVVIAINYMGDKIKEYFGDGSKFGVRISYVEEKEPLGTAGSLKLVKALFNEPFLMINGDNLFDIDLESFYHFHKDGGGFATIALTTVDDPKSFGVAMMRGNKILKFIEKPEIPPSRLINAGVYVLEPEIIDMIPNGYSMIETDVFPKIADDGKLLGYSFEGQWFPTDNNERYETAIKEWKCIE